MLLEEPNSRKYNLQSPICITHTLEAARSEAATMLSTFEQYLSN